jgi:hypothetical protein
MVNAMVLTFKVIGFSLAISFSIIGGLYLFECFMEWLSDRTAISKGLTRFVMALLIVFLMLTLLIYYSGGG